MEEISQSAIIKIITFVGTVTVGQQKKHYHWFYLKETDPNLKKYDKADDLLESKNLDGSYDASSHMSTAGLLLFPYFKAEKNQSDLAKFYAKRIREFIALTYLGFAALILEFMYLD